MDFVSYLENTEGSDAESDNVEETLVDDAAEYARATMDIR